MQYFLSQYIVLKKSAIVTDLGNILKPRQKDITLWLVPVICKKKMASTSETQGKNQFLCRKSCTKEEAIIHCKITTIQNDSLFKNFTRSTAIRLKKKVSYPVQRCSEMHVIIVLIEQFISYIEYNKNPPYSTNFFLSCCQHFKRFSLEISASENVQVLRYRGEEVRSVFSGSLLVT